MADDSHTNDLFVSVVLAHANDTLRALPWRETRDPWAVCVSEVMLQQTQVARVVPYFARFMAAFPTVNACAQAPQGAIVAAFSGLGYNRRAVFLHRSAKAVHDRYDGVFPDTLAELLALDGIGPYTARAILAFAFERDVAVVDTNVSRLIARACVGRPVKAREVQAYADALVPTGQGWLWNQGILDFAATICTKRAPKCEVCPFVSACAWRRAGEHAPDPAEGSAFVTGTQAPFSGSDRQGRGRLVAALSQGTLAYGEVATITGWHDAPERVERVVSGLIRDGLVTRHGDTLELTA